VNANLDNFAFPVLILTQGDAFPASSRGELLKCTKTALKNGFFSRALIVDSQGKTVRVAEARKVAGIGRFWGYNIFLNQNIEVELILEGGFTTMSAGELRKEMNKATNIENESIPGWAKIDGTESVSDLIQIIAQAYEARY